MIDQQKSLFDTSLQPSNIYEHDCDPRKRSRRSDPTTSKQAAGKVDLAGNKKLFFETLKVIGKTHPRTAYEVAAAALPYSSSLSVAKTSKDRETLRKRALDLVRLGLIRECGKRMCRVNVNECMTYEVVE